MRKIKIIYGTTAISVLCLLVSLVVSDMGSLLAYILMNVFMFMIGVTALLAGLLLNKDKNGKHDIKFLTITIIISLIFLFILAYSQDNSTENTSHDQDSPEMECAKYFRQAPSNQHIKGNKCNITQNYR